MLNLILNMVFHPFQEEQSSPPSSPLPSAAVVTVDDAAVQRIADEAAAASRVHPEPLPAHAMIHEIGHGEPVSLP